MASKSGLHIRPVCRENRAHSIWSIRTSVALCHISLSVERRISSPFSKTPLRRCGRIRLERKTVSSRSLKNGSQWSRIRRIAN
jgi:hypothetical protein